LENRKLAQENPALFLERFSTPLLIDEIQYAPELLPYIKALVDEKHQKGMFWITGSQQFHLMKNVSESLAGRVGILNLEGLSLPELMQKPFYEKFIPTNEWISKRAVEAEVLDLKKLYQIIWRGSYPALNNGENVDWEDFYSSYVQTYIERDIRQLVNISEEMSFLEVLTALAARSGQLLNFSDVARDIGKPVPTIKRWVSLLQTSSLIYLLYPFSKNISNRATKMPKIYFMDTGLACYLTKWNTPEVLEKGAKSGEILETFVFSEILKSYWHNGRKPAISFYRDKEKKEIDIIMEENGKVYPIEIKKKSNPDKKDIKNFDVLQKAGLSVGEGAVICLASTHLPLSENVNIIPVSYL
jgi:predicted AAA+ superfamily ATPase